MLEASSIVLSVCDFRGVSLDDLRGKDRRRAFSWPRQEVAALLHEMTNLSLTQIGIYVGGADHTTILHSIKAVSRREKKCTYRAEMDELRAKTLPVFPVIIPFFKSVRKPQ